MIPRKPRTPHLRKRRLPTLFLKPTFTIRPSADGGLDVTVTAQPRPSDEQQKTEPPPGLAFA